MFCPKCRRWERLKELMHEILKGGWPTGYKPHDEDEHLMFDAVNLSREAVADRALREIMEAKTLEEAKALAVAAQERRLKMA